jgi:NhaP-type Na+/H+ or K+/H+ antiporter
MIEHLLVSLSAVIALGTFAQWLGWRLGFPSILLLLLFGILAGPVTGLVDPATMLGKLLYPVVSLAVALILFEGGLSLSVKEFRAVGGLVARLVTVGMLVTWGLSLLAARWLLGLDWPMAILLGAILVVSGPTVVGPLLHHIRPAGVTGPALKWEGIVIDPVGAVLAVLVFETMISGQSTWSAIATNLGLTVATGALLGVAGAAAMVLMLKREWLPDDLHVPMMVSLVVVVFTASDGLRPESGLLAVTVLGFAMANQKYVSVRHIVEFKENLRMLLIASIFILLAANLHAADLNALGFGSIFFLAALVLLVRPAAVFVATLGCRLELKEKLFMAWLAPRGIVAAAVASVFALRLDAQGYPGADRMVAITFFVIIGTVVIYGLSSARIARRLGLTRKGAEGVMVLGGVNWVRQVAKALKEEQVPVMLVDNNWYNVRQARMEGIPAFYANIYSDTVLERVELGGIGRLLAMTSNDDVNSLVALHFAPIFERNHIYQLYPEEQKLSGAVSGHLRGRSLFVQGMSHSELSRRFFCRLDPEKDPRGRALRLRKLPLHLPEPGSAAVPGRRGRTAPGPHRRQQGEAHAGPDHD